ncbi:unnamed protein product [Boreogadus saida]
MKGSPGDNVWYGRTNFVRIRRAVILPAPLPTSKGPRLHKGRSISGAPSQHASVRTGARHGNGCLHLVAKRVISGAHSDARFGWNPLDRQSDQWNDFLLIGILFVSPRSTSSVHLKGRQSIQTGHPAALGPCMCA